MMFASWSYDGGKVIVRPRVANNSLEYYIENTEWKLDVSSGYSFQIATILVFQTFRYGTNIKYYDCCVEPFSDVRVHLKISKVTI